MGNLPPWISLALVVLIRQIQGTLAVDIKSCNTSSLIEQNKELGLRGNVIPDGSFYASSVSDDSHGPQRGRLDQRASGGQASCWCAEQVNTNQWLAVDLVFTAEVTAIATQGQYDPSSLGLNPNYTESWVTKYTLEYSNDNTTYTPLDYKTEKPLEFQGNTDGNTSVCHELPYTLTVRYLRIRPKEWNDNTICLRIGVFGTSLGSNGTIIGDPFLLSTGDPGYDGIWWWTLFWVLLCVILVALVLGLLFYWCIVRRRTYSQEKLLKIKPPKPPVQRLQVTSYTNEGYNMSVLNTSGANTPETVELEGDEIQEVTAEFTADEEENKKGIVGFSVSDENKDHPDGEDSANGDVVNWEEYRNRALQRPEHTYVNVEDVDKETK